MVACAGCNLIFGGSLPTNEAILMHEALQKFTELSDLQLQYTLNG
jgi:hypothetical protein